MRPLLVGEVNTYGANPDFALYPLPEHATGGRLARILDLSRGEYLRRFDRVNLCAGRWQTTQARTRAGALQGADPDQPFILLGRRVGCAFGLRSDTNFWTRIGLLYLLPHPSGLNHAWNDQRAVARTREFLAEFLRP